jgi:hypothetical protein
MPEHALHDADVKRYQYNFKASCNSRGLFTVLVITPKLPPLNVVFGPENCG